MSPGLDLRTGARLLFQGDSITDCGRSPRDEEVPPNTGLGAGYPLILSSQLLERLPAKRLECFNRGISGNRIVDLYARWRIDAIKLRPDIISILIGVNDTWHAFKRDNGVEVDRYEQIFRLLLDYTRAQLPETRLVLLEPFALLTGEVQAEWIAEMKLRQEIVARLAGDFSAIFVPLQKPFEIAAADTGPTYWLHDGVHPTPAGHALIARAWLRATGLGEA
ncbi:MAG: SGNH/GDSL hydrolase family protein [Opitutales bacterium]|nr:SGNH/GDSL hydrolase family protein [Opitutales bacterium]